MGWVLLVLVTSLTIFREFQTETCATSQRQIVPLQRKTTRFAGVSSNVKIWHKKAVRELNLGSKRLAGGHNVMQYASELAHYANFIGENNISSYLEMGANSGKLVAWLHDNFHFSKVAAVSLNQMRSIDQHSQQKEIQTFVGNSTSQEYKRWRRSIGHFDLVLIDGDHSYEGCLEDYLFEKTQSHTFLAFHDTMSSKYPGVRRVWQEHVTGVKVEFANLDPSDPAKFTGVARVGRQACGIGIVLG